MCVFFPIAMYYLTILRPSKSLRNRALLLQCINERCVRIVVAMMRAISGTGNAMHIHFENEIFRIFAYILLLIDRESGKEKGAGRVELEKRHIVGN